MPAYVMWSAATDDYTASPALSRFRFLATKMKEHECSASSTTTNPEAASAQLARYLIDAAESGSGSGYSFWSSRRVRYSKILPLAEDLLAAPASQASTWNAYFRFAAFSLLGAATV